MMSAIYIPLEERLIGHILRKHVKRNGEKPFITMAENTLSYGDFDDRCRSVGRGFARLGIGDGSRIALMVPNCVEFVLVWLAASLIGATTVPLNPGLKGILLESILKDCCPDAIVVHATLLDELKLIDAAILPLHVFVVGEGAREESFGNCNIIPFSEVPIPTGTDPEIDGDFRRIQMISYTSGTTGPSKGALITNATGFCAPLNYIKTVGMTPDDSIFTPLPLFHGMSTRHGVMPALVMGSHITIDQSFSASRYWERAAECQATLALVVSALAPLLKAQPESAGDRAHHVRALFNCKHNEEFEERFGVRMVSAFAMTETSHVLHTSYPQRRLGSVGKVNDEWEAQLVNEFDQPVATGESGELICRPRYPYTMMSGYLNKPDVTLEAYRNLWFHTGDILRQDGDGYFYYIDRKKDRIRRRGENVSSAEVELLIGSHPDIAECAAVAHPADMGEDDIRAVIVLRDNSKLEPDELYRWLSVKMPKFMLPTYIEFVPAIPRTGTGKAEKQRLFKDGLTQAAWKAPIAPRTSS